MTRDNQGIAWRLVQCGECDHAVFQIGGGRKARSVLLLFSDEEFDGWALEQSEYIGAYHTQRSTPK